MDLKEEMEIERSVRVRLTASETVLKLLNVPQLEETPSIAVPASIGKKGLSSVVLHFLQELGIAESELPKAFEFLDIARESLVRSTLEKHMKKFKLSEEDILVLEYSIPQVTRFNEEGPGAPTPDWISTLCLLGNLAIAGTFDGSLVSARCNADGPALKKTEANAHQSQITAVTAFVRENQTFVASASKDASVAIRRVEEDDSFSSKITICTAESGKSLETIASARSSDDPMDVLLATGGWSGEIHLFQASCERPQEEVGSTKGRDKRSKKEAAAGQCSPSYALRGHTDKVSSCVWSTDVDPITLYSGSWDHTLRVWDCVRQVETATLHAQKPLNSIDYLASKEILASAHPDHVVRLWDARASGDAVVKLTLKGHTGWVSSVAFQGGDSTLLASASYDRAVRVWDIRGGAPLQTIQTDVAGKLFAVAWGPNGRLVLGGSDSNIRSYVAEGA